MPVRIADSIEKERRINAPIEKVYAALTKPELFVQWFQGSKIDKGSLKPGEISIFDFGACGGKCAVFVVDARPHHYFAYRWVVAPENPQIAVDDPRKHNSTLVEFHLETVGKGTRVRVVESGFASLTPEQIARNTDHMAEGWTIMTGMLAEYFEKI